MGITNSQPKKDEYPPDEPMPVGTFDAKVVFAMVKSDKAGNPVFAVKFADVASRVAWGNFYTSEKALPYTRKKLEALGLSGAFLDADDTTAEEIAEALIGGEATITVVNEEYNGKQYLKVSWVN